MIKRLEASLSVASAANGIGAGSREISQASDDLARRTENHVTNLAEAAEKISQITGSVGEAAEGAAQTNALVNVAVSEAKQSGSIVRKARSAERRVGKESVRTCRSRWSQDH